MKTHTNLRSFSSSSFLEVKLKKKKKWLLCYITCSCTLFLLFTLILFNKLGRSSDWLGLISFLFEYSDWSGLFFVRTLFLSTSVVGKTVSFVVLLGFLDFGFILRFHFVVVESWNSLLRMIFWGSQRGKRLDELWRYSYSLSYLLRISSCFLLATCLVVLDCQFVVSHCKCYSKISTKQH